MIKQYILRRPQNNFAITLIYKGVSVKVSFTGGNTYKNSFPKFSTNDPFKQRAIEASTLYKDHEIVCERQIEEDRDHVRQVTVQRRKISPTKMIPLQSKPQKPQKPAEPAEPQQPAEPAEPQKPAGTDPNIQDDQAGDGNVKSMTFGSLAEAILFIAENFQETAETEKAARTILKDHGINPTIKKG